MEWPETKALLDDGQAILEKEHKTAEETKVGFLRAGNTGTFNPETGKANGSCPRVAFARQHGKDIGAGSEDAKEINKHLMFQVGVGNEDFWMLGLIKSWPGLIKRESEIPINWQTEDGTQVSGRPDIVLCATDGVPVRGLELKQICSFWTASKVLSDAPKPGHIQQAAHYMWRLSEQTGKVVPFELWYTSRVNFYVHSQESDGKQTWVSRKLPREGERHSQYLTYKDGLPFNVLPFQHGFKLWFDEEGVVWYKPWDADEESDNVKTNVTREGIRQFFEHVSTLRRAKTLPPRPVNIDLNGKRMSWKPCDYCPLGDVCTKAEADNISPIEWLKRI